jgi:hypothetical protein
MVVLAGHGLLLVLLCWTGTPRAPVTMGDEGLLPVSLVAIAPSVQAAKPSPMTSKQAIKATEPAEPLSEEGLAPAEVQPEASPESTEPQLSQADTLALEQFNPPAQTGEPGTACELTATLASLFAQSPEVKQGLAGLPISQRSVANAVMLWDGQWPADSLTGGQALLRSLLVKAVSTARPDCLQKINQGPVLFLVPEQQTTVVLAVGSGQWRWADLLADQPGGATTIAANNYFMPAASVISSGP